MEPKKLYRSNTDRVIAGVCAGIAEYINMDATVVRLLFVIFGLTGAGLIAYLLAAAIIPVRY